VTDGCGGSCLALEAGDGFAFLQAFITQYVWSDGFNGDLAREQILVAGEIDLTHRTASETFFEQIPRGEQASARQSMFGVCLILRADRYVVFVADFATWTLAHGSGF
jgi:hypothetical protein